MTRYTLDDLAVARAEHLRWEDRWANSTANNPDKHEGAIRAAAAKVRLIEEELKEAGLIARSVQEHLEAALDNRFPDARSREVVEYEGQRYQRVFYPIQHSRSRKSVSVWGKEWRHCKDE